MTVVDFTFRKESETVGFITDTPGFEGLLRSDIENSTQLVEILHGSSQRAGLHSDIVQN